MVNQALRTFEYAAQRGSSGAVACQRLPGAVMPRKIEKQVALDRAFDRVLGSRVPWHIHGYADGAAGCRKAEHLCQLR